MTITEKPSNVSVRLASLAYRRAVEDAIAISPDNVRVQALTQLGMAVGLCIGNMLVAAGQRHDTEEAAKLIGIITTHIKDVSKTVVEEARKR